MTSIAPPFYYTFGAKVNDGIEDSATVWTDKYYVTGAPAIKEIYNTASNINVEGMGSYTDKNFYFSKKLCLDFIYDEGYINKTFTLKNSSVSAMASKVQNQNILRVFFDDCNIYSSGEHTLMGYFLNQVDCSC